MSNFPNVPPWNGEQSNDFSKVPWYFPSLEYNRNYINEIRDAFNNKNTYSWIRIGDGELAILQQEYVYTVAYLKNNVAWSGGTGYCGSMIPNLELRDRIIAGINSADLVGVFKGDPVNETVFEKIGLKPKSICYAFDNIALPMNPDFVQILIDARLFIVGKNAQSYANSFKEILDKDVVGIAGINDYSEIDKCMNEMCQYDYDIALVSAGANAKAICPEMAKRKNAIFLDMGHAWDNAFHPKGMYDEYWLIPKWKENKLFYINQQVIHDRKLFQATKDIQSSINPIEDNSWRFIRHLQ